MRVVWNPTIGVGKEYGTFSLKSDGPLEDALISKWFNYDKRKLRFMMCSCGGYGGTSSGLTNMSLCIGFQDEAAYAAGDKKRAREEKRAKTKKKRGTKK